MAKRKPEVDGFTVTLDGSIEDVEPRAFSDKAMFFFQSKAAWKPLAAVAIIAIIGVSAWRSVTTFQPKVKVGAASDAEAAPLDPIAQLKENNAQLKNSVGQLEKELADLQTQQHDTFRALQDLQEQFSLKRNDDTVAELKRRINELEAKYNSRFQTKEASHIDQEKAQKISLVKSQLNKAKDEQDALMAKRSKIENIQQKRRITSESEELQTVNKMLKANGSKISGLRKELAELEAK